MKTFIVSFLVVIIILVLTRLFGLWPEWMIRAELVIKAWLGG
jgi:hypothetical protein